MTSTNEQQVGSTSRERVLADENEMDDDQVKEAPGGLAKKAPEGPAEGSTSRRSGHLMMQTSKWRRKHLKD
jgi:hypothetical protein